MAVISVTVSSTSITLSDSNPYSIVSARGMGGADIRRVTTEGPTQDGDVDQGYRLAPREIELVIGIQATSDILLDGYRDTLTSFFKPLTATPVKLRIVRDDGEIRQIDCNIVGSVKIDLLAMHRPGHYHRATVRLRAPDPAWYELAPGTASFTGSASFDANWWLGGGAIGTAQVLMHGGTPALNETWSYAGTIGTATSFTIAVKAAYVSPAGTAAYMFTGSTVTTAFFPQFGVSGTNIYGTAYPYYLLDTNPYRGSVAMSAGTRVYFHASNPDGFDDSTGFTYPPYRDFKAYWIDNPVADLEVDSNLLYLVGTAMKWRTLGWSGAIPFYALYSPALTYAQRNALAAQMYGTAGTVAQTLAIAYEGDLPEYPTISITGPITNPIVTNTATNETLDFTGLTIGAGTTYIIDTRYSYKTVTQGTANKIDQLTDDSDLGTWHLAPSPIATGGTNLIALYGSGNGSATSISVVYYNRYMSF